MAGMVPTIRYEGVIIDERRGAEGDYAQIAADALLLGGSKGLSWFRQVLVRQRENLPGSVRPG